MHGLVNRKILSHNFLVFCESIASERSAPTDLENRKKQMQKNPDIRHDKETMKALGISIDQ